jgi:hypothetical protein
MKDEALTTVAAFNSPHEAALAKNLLAEEGITAYVVDAETVGMIWHAGGALGGVKVQVAESDARRARAVLASRPGRSGPERPDDYGLEERVQAGPRPRLRLVEEEPEDEDEAPESEADEIGTRAWRAAIIGLLALPPILHFYSFWLLCQLPWSHGTVSPAVRSKVVGAAIVDAVVFLVLILLLRALLLPPAPRDPFAPPVPQQGPQLPLPQFP